MWWLLNARPSGGKAVLTGSVPVRRGVSASIVSGAIEVAGARGDTRTLTGAAEVAIGQWRSNDWQAKWDAFFRYPGVRDAASSATTGSVQIGAGTEHRTVLAAPTVIGQPWYADAWALTASTFRADILTIKKLYDELKALGSLENPFAALPQVHNHSTYSGSVLVAPADAALSSTLTGYDGVVGGTSSGPRASVIGCYVDAGAPSTTGRSATLSPSLLVLGGAADAPCRGYYVVDAQTFTVRFFRGDRWVELPPIPFVETWRAAWLQPDLSHDFLYWSPATVLFPFYGGLVLVIRWIDANGATTHVVVRFDYRTGTWEDWTPSVTVVDRDEHPPWQFGPRSIVPYAAMAQAFGGSADATGVYLAAGDAIALYAPAKGWPDYQLSFSFATEAATGFFAVGRTTSPEVPASVLYRFHGDQTPVAGVDVSTLAGLYSGPGEGYIKTPRLTSVEQAQVPDWLVFTSMGGPSMIRGLRVTRAKHAAVQFSTPINYRGCATWMASAGDGGYETSYSFSPDRTLTIRRTAVVGRSAHDDAHRLSPFNAGAVGGRLVPHLDRLRFAPDAIGATGSTVPAYGYGFVPAPYVDRRRFAVDPAPWGLTVTDNRAEALP